MANVSDNKTLIKQQPCVYQNIPPPSRLTRRNKLRTKRLRLCRLQNRQNATPQSLIRRSGEFRLNLLPPSGARSLKQHQLHLTHDVIPCQGLHGLAGSVA